MGSTGTKQATAVDLIKDIHKQKIDESYFASNMLGYDKLEAKLGVPIFDASFNKANIDIYHVLTNKGYDHQYVSQKLNDYKTDSGKSRDIDISKNSAIVKAVNKLKKAGKQDIIVLYTGKHSHKSKQVGWKGGLTYRYGEFTIHYKN